MVDQSRRVDNRVFTKANGSVVGSYASKYVNVFEIVKVNLRFFEFESDFCMAGLLILENMVIWTGRLKSSFASNRPSKVGGIDLVSPTAKLPMRYCGCFS